MDVVIEPVATLTVYRIPACPQCRSPNPKQLSHCENCGHAAPPITNVQTVEAIVTDG